MLNTHRREYILHGIAEKNSVLVADIAKRFDVSGETARRDLMDLEKEGLLRRVRGGAIGSAGIRDEPISERVQKAAKEKGIIAQLAAELIADNGSIFLHVGSTTEALARQLGQFSDLKVYTNSLNIAQIAKDFSGVTVFVAPGKVRPIESDIVGYDTISYIEGYMFDMAFISPAGIELERGFMDFDEDEVRIRQAVLKAARNSVFLADSSKFGKAANIITARFESVDRFVTDKKLNPEFQAKFSEAGTEVIHD